MYLSLLNCYSYEFRARQRLRQIQQVQWQQRYVFTISFTMIYIIPFLSHIYEMKFQWIQLQTTTACDDGTQDINCHPGFTPCCSGELDNLTWPSLFLDTTSLIHYHLCIDLFAAFVFMIGLVCQGHPPRCEAPTSSTSSTATTTTVSVHPFIR